MKLKRSDLKYECSPFSFISRALVAYDYSVEVKYEGLLALYFNHSIKPCRQYLSINMCLDFVKEKRMLKQS